MLFKYKLMPSFLECNNLNLIESTSDDFYVMYNPIVPFHSYAANLFCIKDLPKSKNSLFYLNQESLKLHFRTLENNNTNINFIQNELDQERINTNKKKEIHIILNNPHLKYKNQNAPNAQKQNNEISWYQKKMNSFDSNSEREKFHSNFSTNQKQQNVLKAKHMCFKNNFVNNVSEFENSSHTQKEKEQRFNNMKKKNLKNLKIMIKKISNEEKKSKIKGFNTYYNRINNFHTEEEMQCTKCNIYNGKKLSLNKMNKTQIISNRRSEGNSVKQKLIRINLEKIQRKKQLKKGLNEDILFESNNFFVDDLSSSHQHSENQTNVKPNKRESSIFQGENDNFTLFNLNQNLITNQNQNKNKIKNNIKIKNKNKDETQILIKTKLIRSSDQSRKNQNLNNSYLIDSDLKRKGNHIKVISLNLYPENQFITSRKCTTFRSKFAQNQKISDFKVRKAKDNYKQNYLNFSEIMKLDKEFDNESFKLDISTHSTSRNMKSYVNEFVKKEKLLPYRRGIELNSMAKVRNSKQFIFFRDN